MKSFRKSAPNRLFRISRYMNVKCSFTLLPILSYNLNKIIFSFGCCSKTFVSSVTRFLLIYVFCGLKPVLCVVRYSLFIHQQKSLFQCCSFRLLRMWRANEKSNQHEMKIFGFKMNFFESRRR